ncbi:MAG: hypothetical protein IJH55_05480 [Romboutsia sp.]|nr:hypothetical protein [Romboutsia sp.]
MIIKLLIPKVYFLYANLVLINMINNYYNETGIIIDNNNLGTLKYILRNIRYFNAEVWSNYIRDGITLSNVLDYSLNYLKKYKDKRLINWKYKEPKANYNYLVYLLFMMGNNNDTILANAEYNIWECYLTMEIRPRL